MPKEKVTSTLDADQVASLRELVGGRSLSAGVNEALAAYVRHLRHLAEVDRWLAEMEAEHGPVPEPDRAWAADLVERWAHDAEPAVRKVG